MITAWDALRFDTPLKWGVTAAASDLPSSSTRCECDSRQGRSGWRNRPLVQIDTCLKDRFPSCKHAA